MNATNLFTSLFSYRPREKLTPKENFLTEALGYVLKKDPAALQAFLFLLLARQATSKENYQIKTQVSAADEKMEYRSFYDLVLTPTKTAPKTPVLFCEHKWDSKCRKDQLAKYDRMIHKKDRYAALVFIAATHDQVDLAEKSVAQIRGFTWADVYRALRKLKSPSPTLTELLEFLNNQGLGPLPPFTRSLLSQNDEATRKRAEMFVAKLASSPELKWPMVPAAYRKTIDWTSRWGRAAFEFYRRPHWDACISAGILFNPSDHKVKLVDNKRGPDLLLRIEASQKRYPDQSAAMTCIATKAPKLRGAKVQMRNDTNMQAMTMLIARQPLDQVLGNATETETQLRIIHRRLSEWLEVLFSDGQLEKALRRSFPIR